MNYMYNLTKKKYLQKHLLHHQGLTSKIKKRIVPFNIKMQLLKICFNPVYSVTQK